MLKMNAVFIYLFHLVSLICFNKKFTEDAFIPIKCNTTAVLGHHFFLAPTSDMFRVPNMQEEPLGRKELRKLQQAKNLCEGKETFCISSQAKNGRKGHPCAAQGTQNSRLRKLPTVVSCKASVERLSFSP